jgi:hypothetical protein
VRPSAGSLTKGRPVPRCPAKALRSPEPSIMTVRSYHPPVAVANRDGASSRGRAVAVGVLDRRLEAAGSVDVDGETLGAAVATQLHGYLVGAGSPA